MGRFVFVLCFTILCFFAAAQAKAGCTPEELDNPLQASDPAYADAIGLAATLQNQSFTIKCVLPSKFAQFLPRQTGAALFRTTIGDFEALFRPKEQNFDDVLISGQRDANRSAWALRNGAGYRYTFRDPQGRLVRDMAGREAFFVTHHNILFITWQKNTAATLTESFHAEP